MPPAWASARALTVDAPVPVPPPGPNTQQVATKSAGALLSAGPSQGVAWAETPHIWTPPPWGSPHLLADVVGAGGIWAWTSHPNWEHLRRPTPAPGLPAEPSEAFAVIASWPSFYFCLALLPSFPTSTDPTSYPPASGNPTVMPS